MIPVRGIRAREGALTGPAELLVLASPHPTVGVEAATAPVRLRAAAGEDVASKVVQLAQLLQQGLLTPEEFAAARAGLPAGAEAAAVAVQRDGPSGPAVTTAGPTTRRSRGRAAG